MAVIAASDWDWILDLCLRHERLEEFGMACVLLDPKNDFVFKKLFVGVPELLQAFINAVRVMEKPKHSQMANPHQVHNPDSIPDAWLEPLPLLAV